MLISRFMGVKAVSRKCQATSVVTTSRVSANKQMFWFSALLCWRDDGREKSASERQTFQLTLTNGSHFTRSWFASSVVRRARGAVNNWMLNRSCWNSNKVVNEYNHRRSNCGLLTENIVEIRVRAEERDPSSKAIPWSCREKRRNWEDELRQFYCLTECLLTDAHRTERSFRKIIIPEI